MRSLLQAAMHVGMASGMTWNGPLLLKQIYALLEYISSMVNQTEMAAVIV